MAVKKNGFIFFKLQKFIISFLKFFPVGINKFIGGFEEVLTLLGGKHIEHNRIESYCRTADN
jgi:hypothetical protein